MLVRLLEGGECGLGGRSVHCRESGDTSCPFPDLHSDMGGIIGGNDYETTQISGTGGHLEPKVIEACLGALNHCRFDN